tara:strand:- start:1865 stop:2107 length:243 start_codon:yes stop_codon:yes gene_type:complete
MDTWKQTAKKAKWETSQIYKLNREQDAIIRTLSSALSDFKTQAEDYLLDGYRHLDEKQWRATIRDAVFALNNVKDFDEGK